MIADSLEKLNFIDSHPRRFEQLTIPAFICLVRLKVHVILEFASIALTASWSAPRDVILAYLGIICIASIDKIYY